MTIAKAITALVMGLLATALAGLNVTPDTPLIGVAEALITFAVVYFIPNKTVNE